MKGRFAILAVLVPGIAAALAPAHVINAHASTSTATINEYTIPTGSSAPTSITSGPDGNLWFTENSGNKIGKITTSGAITEYTIPAGASAPQAITAGPDNALWFTETAANQIGRITIDGNITEFPVTTTGSGPWGITAGPDGNLWFTEQSSGNVAKIDPTTGQVTEYPTGGCGLGNITKGADGNLWFVDCGSIAKVTTGGTVTPYPVPCCINDVVAGPDGNMWLADADNNSGVQAALRMSTSGTNITRFPDPSPVTDTPQGITVGPNGALFMSGSDGNVIESSTSGVMTEFPLPDASANPTSITTGSDNGIWFVESGTNAIGTLVIPDSCAAVGVNFDHTPVGPGVPLTATLSILNCGGSATISGATTSTSTTPPSGCPTAPAITELSATIAPGQSAQQSTTFKGPSCTGDYAVSSTASASGSTIGTATGTYTTALGAPVAYRNPGADSGDRPKFITPGPDGNLWFTENGTGNHVVRMTTAGATTSFTTQHGAPQAITWGPDGNLWFLDGFGPVFVGRMTPAGHVVSEVQAPPSENVANLTAGPDGNMWLIAENGDTGNADLIRMTLSGKFKVFPNVVASVGLKPLTVAPGPDGNVWFGGLDTIGSITPNGHVTVLPAIGGGGNVRSLALGPDGNMWFTYPYSAVGRVTPAGGVTLFATSRFAGPAVITTAADGNLWFSQIFSRTNEVARITPAGGYTEFPVPNQEAANAQFGTTAGPDGNVWMSAYYGFNMVQIGIAPPTTCAPVAVTAASPTVAKGSPEVVSTVATNCSASPRMLKLVTKTQAPSGCSGPPVQSSTLPLQPKVGTTEASSFTPTCAGTYRVTSTLFSGKSALGSSTTSYQVS